MTTSAFLYEAFGRPILTGPHDRQEEIGILVEDTLATLTPIRFEEIARELREYDEFIRKIGV